MEEGTKIGMVVETYARLGCAPWRRRVAALRALSQQPRRQWLQRPGSGCGARSGALGWLAPAPRCPTPLDALALPRLRGRVAGQRPVAALWACCRRSLPLWLGRLLPQRPSAAGGLPPGDAALSAGADTAARAEGSNGAAGWPVAAIACAAPAVPPQRRGTVAAGVQRPAVAPGCSAGHHACAPPGSRLQRHLAAG